MRRRARRDGDLEFCRREPFDGHDQLHRLRRTDVDDRNTLDVSNLLRHQIRTGQHDDRGAGNGRS